MATSLLLSSATTTSWDGIYADLLEHVPALQWPTSVRTYSEMRTDPKLTAVLAAYTLPLRRAAAAVDGAGCRPEVTQLVADGLGLPILGQDPVPSGARRRGVRWARHVRMALLHLVFGHMPFELEVDDDGQRTRLVGLHERMPVTITDIRTDRAGQLAGITQDSGVVVNRDIPAERLAWYVHDREGAAWQGRSLLRGAYAPWLIKHEMQRVLATSNRRFGMGVPSVEAPAGATPAQVLEAQRLASTVRAGEQAGAGLPPGFKLALTGITGSTPDTLGFLRWLDQQMSGMALTGVLDLGDTANGSRALGETFVELLLLSLQAIADDVADVTTSDVAVRLVDWNWGEDEPVPAVVFGDVGASHQVTAEALNSLLTSGALSADLALEEYVRREWKLPARGESQQVRSPIFKYDLDAGTATVNDRRKQLGLDPVEGGDVPAALYLQNLGLTLPTGGDSAVVAAAVRESSRQRRVVAAAGTGGLRRQPTAFEAAAKTDFTKIQADWQSALDQLVADWADITAAQRAQIVAQVRAAAAADDVTALASLEVDSQAAAEQLAEALHEAADQAAADAAAEAGEQDVEVDLDQVDVDRDRLDDVAATVTALLAAGLAAAAARKALQVWGPSSTPDQVAGDVEAHLGSLTDGSLRDGLGGGLTVAQNAGRAAVLERAPAAAAYAASEILDANTCGPCQQVDGQVFGDLAAAEEAYAGGGYSGCEGGLRCRGVIVAIWDAAAVPSAA